MTYPVGGAEGHGGIDYQRVKRAYDFDDYAALAFNAAGGAEVVYVVGTNAFLAGGIDPATGLPPLSNIASVADPTIPMFEAKCLLLIPTVDCLVRFEPDYRIGAGLSTRIQHPILVAFSPYTIFRRCTAIHVIGAVGAGVLRVHFLG